MIYESIQKLIKYAERNGLITADDEYVVRNQLMEILQLSDWEENNADDRNASVEALLEPIISYAVEKGLIQDTAVYRDLFDTKIMGVFTPFPHEVNAEFQRRLAVSPKEATDWYFDFSKKLGAQIIQNLTGRSVPVVLDPTMLLTEQAWTALEKKPNYKVKKQFLLTYFLGALSRERQAFIQNIADKYDLQWIALDSEWVDKPQNSAHYMTTPDEFIWLVHHCQLMLTDSFHGSVFSILFGKPFRSFTREDNNLDMGSRLDTLFGSLGIGDWCRGSVQEDPEHIFYKDYASVPAVLERERQFALDYLKNALEIHE